MDCEIEQEMSMKKAASRDGYLLHDSFLLGLIFSLQILYDMFHRNVG
jgi:hypothetical protein